MQEITIPDGHKATILGGTIRIEPIEKVQEPKFKKGDIVARNFRGFSGEYIVLYDHTNSYGWIMFNVYIINSKLHIKDKVDFGLGSISEFRIATPEEQQILFNALAKEGKYWDAEALEVKDFIKVPESIGIYKWFGEDEEYKCGDNLFIGFNNDKQLLGYDDTNKCYLAYPKRNAWQKIQCYLKPCKRKDLQSGDTAFFSPTFRLFEDITSDLGRYVKIVGKANYKTNKSGEIVQERNYAALVYKLIPINK